MKTEEAVGQTLCHDITGIVKDVVKDAVFRKGHIITSEDIPLLLDLGKEHIYIWEDVETMLHENDAAGVLRDICINSNMIASLPKEGKIDITADVDGLFIVDTKRLLAVNSLGDMMIATRNSGFPVKRGDKVCGTRVIPLMIEKERMERAKQAAGSEPLFRLYPIKQKKYGLITTGSEIYNGRINDEFSSVVKQKMGEYGCRMSAHAVIRDDDKAITSAIEEMLNDGAEMILCTGGMSVDPDDRTPLAIRNAAPNVVSYGAPVLPGAMFMLAYTDDGRAVCGLPGCVMYAGHTVFDLVLPYLLADAPITAEQLSGMGNGGLCLKCEECHFPNCGFGKGF